MKLGLLNHLFGRSRESDEEAERRRRQEVFLRGRLTDGIIHEISGTIVFYSYTVRGVTYEASQDLRGLVNSAEELSSVSGSVAVKYLPENPANSIVACEQWSGITGFRPSPDLSEAHGSNSSI